MNAQRAALCLELSDVPGSVPGIVGRLPSGTIVSRTGCLQHISYSTNLCATYSHLPHYFQMMSSRSNLFYCLTSAILLTHSVTQALHPLRAPSQIITKIDETPHNGSAVPGASPVKYHNDPGNDLFRIESLDMHPNPCVMYTFYSRFPT